MRSLLLVALVGSVAVADPAPFRNLDDLGKSLPSGWGASLDHGTLTIADKARVRRTGMQFWSAHTTNLPQPAPSEGAQWFKLAITYRAEPRWTEEQYEHARGANAIIYRALVELREKHPADDAEYTRLSQNLMSRLVQLPRCTLGSVSVFDNEDTYEQLAWTVEPAVSMRRAFAVVELMKRRCR